MSVIGELSEGEVLRAILERTPASTFTVLGPGDDAAVVAAPSGSVIATVDSLVDGPDFRREWTSAYDLGWKAAAVNLSDIAAMGGTPTALLVALALPLETPLEFIEQLYEGLRDACESLSPGCAVVGGDLTRSTTMTVVVTALGDLGGRAPLTRSGARSGDIVALCGDAGVAARGLDVLFTRFSEDGQALPLDRAVLSEEEREAVERQLRPMPPVAAGVAAAEAGATAAMDVSDGLSLDANRMATASDVTINFESAALGPNVDPALRGGEDHALLVTFPADAALPSGFRRIGTVEPAATSRILLDGEPITPRGWDPYSTGESQ